MKRVLLILGAGLLSLMHPAAAQATLLDYTFSFTGTVPPGFTAGTVTGEIFGLTEGATSSATNVVVDSYPASLEPPAPPQTEFTGPSPNSFTVDANGVLIAADFSAGNTSGNLFLAIETIGDNISLTAHLTAIVDEFSSVTFTLVAPVPAPIIGAGIPGLVAGLGAFLFWRGRSAAAAFVRRRHRSYQPAAS